MTLIPNESAVRLALLESGTHTIEDVHRRIDEGRAQVWVHQYGTIITEIIDHPRLSELNYWIVAGDIGDCMKLIPHIEAYGRSMNVARSIGTGRRGFQKVLEKHGWKLHAVTMVKEMTE